MTEIFRRKKIFILKHYDFILIDLVAFVLGFGISLALRRALHMSFYNQNLLLTYGAVAAVSFLIDELISEKLNGVVARGLMEELKTVVGQMTITMSIYLSLCFLMHNIFGLSRIITVVSYLLCSFFILLFRTLWKMLSRYSRLSETMLPKLLIVCEASGAQKVLDRLLPGSLSKEYDLCGIVVNEQGTPDYHDWYPCEAGLEKIDDYIRQRRVQGAYVELSRRDEEEKVINRLLDAGIIVYRSLGESVLHYADQDIDQLNGKSVITITGTRTTLTSRADQAWQRIRAKFSKYGE